MNKERYEKIHGEVVVLLAMGISLLIYGSISWATWVGIGIGMIILEIIIYLYETYNLTKRRVNKK